MWGYFEVRQYVRGQHCWEHPASIVGVSLLAIASAHPTSHQLTHRNREQARSHRGPAGDYIPAFTHINCGSEPARDSVGISNIASTDPPHREQARSYRGFAVDITFAFTLIHCGSEPARDCVGTSNISSTDPPHREQAHSYRGPAVVITLAFTLIHCGSELARDSFGVSTI